MCQTSDSGFVEDSRNDISTNEFVDFAEIPCAGFNCLYKAKRYGKWFVLKGLKPEYSAIPLYRELLNKEFELGMMLDHPNIVTIYGREHVPAVGDCIVMEYVDGMTLSDFLKSSPTKAVARKIVDEILSAMSYFHGLQLIHRDIKPSNILITRNGNNVKIIDFGFSDTDSHAILKQPAGTAKYAAPEQYKVDASVDCRADIYSFGMVLKDIVASAKIHGYGSIVKRCTKPNADDRFDNASAVLTAIKSHKRNISILFVVLAILLVGVSSYFVSRYAFKSKNAESAVMPDFVTDTIVRIDTIVHVDTMVVYKESSDTIDIDLLLEEYSKEVDKICTKQLDDFKRNNVYVELASCIWSKTLTSLYDKRLEVASRIPNTSPLYSNYLNMSGLLIMPYQEKYVSVSQELPSYMRDFSDQKISKAEYDSITLLFESYSQK